MPVKSPKRRNKAHNPNKLVHRVVPPIPLTMDFDVDYTNQLIDQWHEQHQSEEVESAPREVVYQAYDGDLIICLKENLIKPEQVWVLSFTHYLNDKATGVDEELIVDFDLPKMTFDELRYGCAHAMIERNDGTETAWQGLQVETNQILKLELPDTMKRLRTTGHIKINAQFKSYGCYQYFLQVKSLRNCGVI